MQGLLPMPYDSTTVVNALLQRAFKEGRSDMTPMKVQKLLFFLNGWHLAVTGKPAIKEPFQAWKFGPVVQTIYHELKKFGGGPITEYVKAYDPQSASFKAFVPAESDRVFYDILDLTWDKYIGIDATRLSAMTHADDSPWSITKEGGGTIIPDEIIKKYFIGLTRNTRTGAAARNV